jgi:hypothetical protein
MELPLEPHLEELSDKDRVQEVEERRDITSLPLGATIMDVRTSIYPPFRVWRHRRHQRLGSWY